MCYIVEISAESEGPAGRRADSNAMKIPEFVLIALSCSGLPVFLSDPCRFSIFTFFRKD